MWLRSLGLEQYETAFREKAITEKLLASLTAEDLKDLGISVVGHRRDLSAVTPAITCKPARANLRGQCAPRAPWSRQDPRTSPLLGGAQRRFL